MGSIGKILSNIVLRRPIFNVVFLTNRCNLNCRMCFYTEREKRDELTTEEYVKLAQSMPPQWYLMFTGGEPFIRDDVYEIASAFIKRGASVIHFSTNGTYKDRLVPTIERLASENKKTNIVVCISIDGDEETHEYIRQIKGCYNKAIESIKLLIELKKSLPNISVSVNFTLSVFNQDKWQSTITFLKDEMHVDTVSIGATRGNTYDKTAKEFDEEEYHRAIDYILEDNRKNYKSKLLHAMATFKDRLQIETIYQILKRTPPKDYYCLASTVFSVITETGDVYPCEMIHCKMGNLRDYNMDFSKVMKTEHAEVIRKRIAKRKCLCTYECAMTPSLAANPSTILKFIPFVFRYMFKKN